MSVILIIPHLTHLDQWSPWAIRVAIALSLVSIGLCAWGMCLCCQSQREIREYLNKRRP